MVTIVPSVTRKDPTIGFLINPLQAGLWLLYPSFPQYHNLGLSVHTYPNRASPPVHLHLISASFNVRCFNLNALLFNGASISNNRSTNSGQDGVTTVVMRPIMSNEG